MNADKLWSLPPHWLIAAPVTLADDATVRYLHRFLSMDERERSERFRKPFDRQRYILSHALKRYCLSNLLSIAPLDLSFGLGDKGKPFCKSSSLFDFNISHGGEWVLFGLSSVGLVGVDIESCSRELSASVASYALSPKQMLSLKEEAPSQERLLLYWTQKEAISKAFGLGLAIGFDSIDCNGRVGSQVVSHSGQELLVDSHINYQHVISCATSCTDKLMMYHLSLWDKNEFKLS